MGDLSPRLEPLDGLVTLDAVARADAALAAAAGADALALAGHADVEVHAVDTDGGVVLDTEINVLRDTESEVAGLGEVALAELVLLDLEATLENLLSLSSSSQLTILPAQFRISPKLSYLGATDGDVDSNLFVTADTEDGGLTGQLLQNLGGTGQSVTRLADGDVEDELLDVKLAHGVLGLLGRHFGG
ncbi:60S ribosomal protein L11 [Colletotrichum scovillei]|uniref:60S ribosomal protein L11 n=1 Tax=Colletotrichum scovillei TaxID=1209932 RepID=A0A9P7RII2_9PEZI|nr:60S ribosomal protein L11 [Colletotrichum scovillei]KAG7077785.1 60S ribosomal protein L11 [Colletotrichum scovillei]KAG7084882.1 60S ribosomal protein L11 [Colletotrichum scovillei]